MRGFIFVLLVAALLVAAAWLGLTRQAKYEANIYPQYSNTNTIGANTYFMAADSGYCEMSYYNFPEHGRKTAFNETFDSLAFTCAIDFNTPIFYNDWLEISSGAVACTVRVNDRMPGLICVLFPDRDIDLSQAAAAKMGMLTEGIRHMKWRKVK